MPWSPGDATKHTKKATTDKLKKRWAATANAALAKCLDDGGDTKTCDATAIRQANASLIKETDVEEEIIQATEAPQEDTEPVEVEELYIDTPEPVSYSGAVTFTDLDAQRDVEGSIQEIRKDTADLWMMVDNVMWHAEVTDKVGALRSLFDEYLVRIQEHLGEESEPEPPPVAEVAESAAIDLSEQSSMLSLAEATGEDLIKFDALLSEQRVELANPRRAPVMVDFAIIKPGHGNKKDKRYYPAPMLEQYGNAFEGTDIYVTNHLPGEKTEKNKVGRFRNIHGLTEQGLVGTAILYDPDQAEKTRNRADAGELHTLRCSICANGTGKKAIVDGQEVIVIETIKKGGTVDLVSKDGAGGHAIALTESDGGTMDEQEKDQNEEPLAEDAPQEPLTEEVEIRESDEQETPAEEAPPPAYLSEDEVSAILAESGLTEKASAWVTGRSYLDADAVQVAIAEMQVFISELVPTAGQPFALGESTPIDQVDVPRLLSPAELEERKYERTKQILSEIAPTYHL